jgi:hypothetical protein
LRNSDSDTSFKCLSYREKRRGKGDKEKYFLCTYIIEQLFFKFKREYVISEKEAVEFKIVDF